MTPTADQIRQQFIDYFVKKHAHTFVPSSPCVPHDDPTLMFANAGMNQFKPIFLGTADPASEFGRLKRAANTQKCIRAGGKHNDLDDVGHDTYHHTFFEMLGNWSFGDYFKKEAIEWAWDLLTNVWGLEKDRLFATYFEGDAAEGLEPDAESAEFWRQVTDIDPSHIHPGNKKDNFWEMGDTGPCGPCSEIHIDLTPDKSGAPLVNAGDPRVIEIWNLVFIQFNRAADGKLSPLPAKHVDTGMGFERIAAVLQGKRSNYDTDIFTPIFGAIQRVTGAPQYTGLLETDDADRASIMRDVAYRVIADHVRCLTFALTDGAVPSNEGRGYVLRRILRRGVRYGRQYLLQEQVRSSRPWMSRPSYNRPSYSRPGALRFRTQLSASRPFLCEVVPTVIEVLGKAFPEMGTAHGGNNPHHVAEFIREEEVAFIKTLDRGLALFEQAADHAVKHHHGRISGEDAFKLHDTYGFPIDLTELMAEERGLKVNIGEYERLMNEARDRARGDSRKTAFFEFAFEHCSDTEFDPDSRQDVEDVHVDVFNDQLDETGSLNPGQKGYLVISKTSFYAEQGGQVGDTGVIVHHAGDWRFIVTNTTKVGGTFVHQGNCDPNSKGPVIWTGNPNVAVGVAPGGPLPKPHSGWEYRAQTQVNWDRRNQIMKNHTSTHILNWALREVLGDHVQQKGSLVDPDKTRFDLSHPSQISDEELTRIETLVNEKITEDLPVHAKELPQIDALKINGLRAVFGEKYPDVVRVVSTGPTVDELLADPTNEKWRQYSVEFCGGTHLKSTGEAGHFVLIEESAVAKGIRRVTGVTADRAEAALRRADELSAELTDAEKLDATELPKRVAALTRTLDEAEIPVVSKSRLRAKLADLRDHAKKLQKEHAKAGASDVAERADELLAAAPDVGGCKIIAGAMGVATVDNLRAAADSLRSRAKSAAVFLAGENDDRVVILAAMTPDVVKRGVKAGDLIKTVAPIVGGKGGGRPDMAQGGGTDASNIAGAVTQAVDWLREQLAR